LPSCWGEGAAVGRSQQLRAVELRRRVLPPRAHRAPGRPRPVPPVRRRRRRELGLPSPPMIRRLVARPRIALLAAALSTQERGSARSAAPRSELVVRLASCRQRPPAAARRSAAAGRSSRLHAPPPRARTRSRGRSRARRPPPRAALKRGFDHIGRRHPDVSSAAASFRAVSARPSVGPDGPEWSGGLLWLPAVRRCRRA
jgi:hypothetical protein